jgi:hypothetical protein
MTIRPISYALNFSADDRTRRPLEELAKQMRVSRAFLQICVDAGCPRVDGQASAADVLMWLFDHYEKVRALAGLKPLAPVELDEEPTAQLRMANALATLLEYSRTRATNLRQKRQLRRVLAEVNLLGDRVA